jgi:hypothetical protein
VQPDDAERDAVTICESPTKSHRHRRTAKTTCGGFLGGGNLRLNGWSMSRLAGNLATWVDRLATTSKSRRRTNRHAMLCMKRGIVASCAVVLLAVPVRADITARWELHADFDDRRIPGASANCTLRQDGERLSGMCEDAPLTGEIKGETVTWRLTPAGAQDNMIFTGMLDDDDTVIVGRFSYAGKGDGSFLAVRLKR